MLLWCEFPFFSIIQTQYSHLYEGAFYKISIFKHIKYETRKYNQHLCIHKMVSSVDIFFCCFEVLNKTSLNVKWKQHPKI